MAWFLGNNQIVQLNRQFRQIICAPVKEAGYSCLQKKNATELISGKEIYFQRFSVVKGENPKHDTDCLAVKRRWLPIQSLLIHLMNKRNTRYAKVTVEGGAVQKSLRKWVKLAMHVVVLKTSGSSAEFSLTNLQPIPVHPSQKRTSPLRCLYFGSDIN